MSYRNNAIKAQFGENLAYLRKQRGYTLQDVAKKIGVEKNAYWNYEKGNRTPPLEKIIALAELFEVSIDDLVNSVLNLPDKLMGLKNFLYSTTDNSAQISAVEKMIQELDELFDKQDKRSAKRKELLQEIKTLIEKEKQE